MSRYGHQLICLAAILITFALITGCSDEVIHSSDEDNGCPSGEYYNPFTETCSEVRVTNNQAGENNSDSANNTGNTDDTNNSDSGNNTPDPSETQDPDAHDDPIDTETPDINDPDPLDHLTCLTDNDGDGYYAIECGGDDCDDDDFDVNPGRTELCSFKDNNCSGTINDNLDCSFYAHTPNSLYRIDPFKNSMEYLMEVPNKLNDIDTHPNGTLYGVTATALYRYNTNGIGWSKVGEFPQQIHATGMCIDSGGKTYLTAEYNLYALDLTSAHISDIGDIGHRSSGDCVITKGDALYMSARKKSGDSGEDRLVLINGQDASANVIGDIGYDRVFGLTAAWNYLFGVTQEGELLIINPLNGQSQLLHTFENTVWYGAASTPGR